MKKKNKLKNKEIISNLFVNIKESGNYNILSFCMVNKKINVKKVHFVRSIKRQTRTNWLNN